MALAQCTAHGISRATAARRVAAGSWARPVSGVYDLAPDGPGDDHEARRRRAAWLGVLAYGPHAIAVGPSALTMLGVAGLPLEPRSEVTLPGGQARRSRGPVRFRRFDDGMRTVTVQGMRVAAPRWAIAQCVPELSRARALAVLDSALARGVIDAAGLDLAHAVARGRRGVATHHDLWALADSRAESPLESYGRLACVEAGVPPHVLQLVVRDATGAFVGRADMAWRLGGGRWLVVEMDGRDVHGAPRAVYADRARQNAMLATGRVEMLRFTGQDSPEQIGAVVRRTLMQLRRPTA
ncbi:hypothetical protein CLV28_0795 [Sediminihabitans luteus]|uniref:Uncharacterized protein n=1 Tax=Sediminihabitans luteus TaxID=1138585 RepID=A0A2M9D044_9CELL|nr:hypothetical protein [Sediminihabitans luteus]PJJ77574.1 hypothetical protein CLV28_0795 [Sediminihabitans luteus]GII98474.1 hypothetical protein Slu03_08520 [Sediminihabitans luteus]